MNIIMKTLDIMGNKLSINSLKKSDFVLTVPTDGTGLIDVDKMEIITFDMVSNTYRVLGEVVGKAFKDGLKLKD